MFSSFLSLGSVLGLVGGVMVVPTTSEATRIHHRPGRSLTFPESSNIGFYLALAVPLDDPYNSISLSYFFEANHNLPTNFSQPLGQGNNDSTGGRRERRIDRSVVYALLANKFESAGFPGHECLLRSICEASEYPLEHNGVLGDIFRVVFTPSSSRAEDDLPEGVAEAESRGRNGTCTGYHSSCGFGLFDLIGVFS